MTRHYNHYKLTENSINLLPEQGLAEGLPRIAEMYLQGVSTRRVTKVMEKLCRLEVSSTQVSTLTAELDSSFKLWRERPLPEIAHLFVDATYIKVLFSDAVRDCAVLTTIGVRREDGKRMILGLSAALSEAEVHWRHLLSQTQRA